MTNLPVLVPTYLSPELDRLWRDSEVGMFITTGSTLVPPSSGASLELPAIQDDRRTKTPQYSTLAAMLAAGVLGLRTNELVQLLTAKPEPRNSAVSNFASTYDGYLEYVQAFASVFGENSRLRFFYEDMDADAIPTIEIQVEKGLYDNYDKLFEMEMGALKQIPPNSRNFGKFAIKYSYASNS